LRVLHSVVGHVATIRESIDLLIKSWSDLAFCIKIKLDRSLCLRTGVQSIRDAALASRDSLVSMWGVHNVQRPKLAESLLFGELSERFGPSYFLSGRMGEMSHVAPKKVRVQIYLSSKQHFRTDRAERNRSESIGFPERPFGFSERFPNALQFFSNGSFRKAFGFPNEPFRFPNENHSLDARLDARVHS
jgi:hypothetical protein